MKRQWIMIMVSLLILVAPMTIGHCETWYAPTFFASDKEALEVLQSLKGSFFGWSNYPKQTVEIDKYGLRLFSEYIGTKKVWNTWDMYYMTVPDLRSEQAILDFKNVSSLTIGNNTIPSATNPWCVTQDNTPATTFCVKDEATARRFADAVATLATVAGAKWRINGGYTIPTSENWFRNKLNWKKNTGAVIKTVVPGGPFERAGLQNEDVLLTFGGQEVTDGAALWKLEQALVPLKAYEIRVATTVYRRGVVLDKEIVYYNYSVKAGEIRKLIDQPATPAALPQEKPKLGATIRSLTDDDVKAMNLTSTAGVLVTGVDSNSTAQRMNLLVNDIIIEVNGMVLKNINHLREILSASTPVSKMKVKRGEVFVDLTVPVSI
ncbi:MAG TPA: PDZ domain-containing protein [Negativicutes bacterium]|nr:PDZ domain-containing protein [Negativicutes bacterium]